MTTRAAFVTIAALLTSLPVGCHKSAGPAAATPVAITDYRTLNQGAIEIIIADKTGSPVTLKPAGPNKYTGTRQVPGDTLRVPVTVTVEEKQIIIETTGGGLTQRQVITPHEVKDDLR
jgi:hypothetical protein